MTFQKLGHFHHLTPFSDFHEQYLKNNPKNLKQLTGITPNISLVQMENNCIITAHWVIWQSQTLITVMVVLIYGLRNHRMNRITLQDFYTNLSLFFLFSLHQNSVFQLKDRQYKLNFNFYKPPSPHGFISQTASLPLLFQLLFGIKYY